MNLFRRAATAAFDNPEDRNVLHLPLKKEWYTMIESGEKQEEYRQIKPYWLKRLFVTKNTEGTHYGKIDDECSDFYCNNTDILQRDIENENLKVKPYTHVCFRYGYTDKSMTFKIDGIVCGVGKSEWGAPKEERVFIIHFH